jgi:signal transduction histidine kinase
MSERGWAVRSRLALVDAAVAGVLAVAAFLLLPTSPGWTGWSPGLLVAGLCLAGVAAAVAACRRHPVLSALVASCLMAVPAVIGVGAVAYAGAAADAATLGLALVALALGAAVPWRWSFVGLVPLVAAGELSAGAFNPLLAVVVLGPWAIGLLLASRQAALDQLRSGLRELDEEREWFAAASIRHERSRIARDLHDVVGHCVSLVVVQANAGEELVASRPEEADRAFAAIVATSREAADEITRLLRLLDTGSDDERNLPGAWILGGLVDTARASGVEISAVITGATDGLSPAAAETAYRVVQEAITNAVKHAPGTALHVEVHGVADAVRVRVENEPPVRRGPATRPAVDRDAGGLGIPGMRDRVVACGGSMQAGPTSAGGFAVSASLPRSDRLGSRAAS